MEKAGSSSTASAGDAGAPRASVAEMLERVRKRKKELEESTVLKKPKTEVDEIPEAVPEVTEVVPKNPYLEDFLGFELPTRKPIVRLAPVSSEEQTKHILQAKLASLTPDERSWVALEAPPAQEWWDENVSAASLTREIHHPREIEAFTDTLVTEDSPLYLTVKEQRRKRRNERYHIRKEAQDRVKLGLDPPAAPKVKMTNIAAVYGTDYTLDPTKYEEMARSEVSKRKAAHEEANAERALTPDARWIKRAAKSKRDRLKGIESAIFRIENLSDAKHQFLVNAAAEKLFLTGLVLNRSDGFSLVVVEGSALEIKKFRNVMENRINWAVNDGQNACQLVWWGPLRHARYRRWSMHRISNSDASLEDLLEIGPTRMYFQAAR